jgi:hypothetical protein
LPTIREHVFPHQGPVLIGANRGSGPSHMCASIPRCLLEGSAHGSS